MYKALSNMKSLKFTMTLLRANIGLLKRPYKLNLYLTDRCNARCKTCNIWQKKPQNELTAEEWSKFFRQNNYFNWIDITGGEIFLRNDIREIFSIILKECRDLYLLHFPTNGFLTERIYDSVKSIKQHFKGRLVVTISMDGDESLHNDIRGVHDGWRKAVETFKKIKSINNGDTFFGYTISKHNIGRFNSAFFGLKKELRDLDYSSIHVNLAQDSEIYYSNTKKDLYNGNEGILKELEHIRKAKKTGILPFELLDNYFFKRLRDFVSDGIYPFTKCSALSSTITITPKGDVYPCLFFNHKLGSLRETGFDLGKILFTEKAEELKKDIIRYCPACWSACEAYPSILSNLLNNKLKTGGPKNHKKALQ